MKPGELRTLNDEALQDCDPEYPKYFLLLDRFEMAFNYRGEEKPYWHIWTSAGMGMLLEEVIEKNSEAINETG